MVALMGGTSHSIPLAVGTHVTVTFLTTEQTA
jgi:hypothetical protein